jgi:excisionase family DNA binding protein
VDEKDQFTLPPWPDAAEILGVGRNKIYELAAQGRIPTIRVGRKIRVLRLPLLRMVGAADAA